MKNITLIIIIAIALQQSCKPLATLPSDLNKSLLLIEKLPIDVVEKDEDGRKIVKERKVGAWGSRFNKKVNRKNKKHFKKYPFAYKMVTAEEVDDNIDSTKTTYYLRNGNSKTTTVYTTNSSGRSSFRDKTVTEVILENLSEKRKSKIAAISGGVCGISKKFVKKASKMKKESKKK